MTGKVFSRVVALFGGNIIAAEPSYSDMPDFAEEIGCEVRWVPLDSEFKLDLDAMEKNIDENTSMNQKLIPYQLKLLHLR